VDGALDGPRAAGPGPVAAAAPVPRPRSGPEGGSGPVSGRGPVRVLLVGRDHTDLAPLTAEAGARGVEAFHAPFDTRRIAALGELPDRVDVVVVQVREDLPAVLEALRHLSAPGRQILVTGAPPGLVERRELLAAGADRVLEGRPDPARTLQIVLAWSRGEGAPLRVMLLGASRALPGLAQELARTGLPTDLVAEASQLTADGVTHGAPALLVDQDSSPLDGVDLCRLLRRRREWDPCPIVLMLSRPDAFLAKRLLSAGVDDVVPASLPPEKIVNVLRMRGRDCQGAVRPGGKETTAGLLLPDAFVSLAASRLERCHDLQVPFVLIRILPEDADGPDGLPGPDWTAPDPETVLIAAADAARSCFRAHDLSGRCVEGGLHAAVAGMSAQDLQLRLPVVRRALEDRGCGRR